jgi:hypothetical protein
MHRSPKRGIDITRALLVDFFDMYLQNAKSQFLKTQIDSYPNEIIVKKKGGFFIEKDTTRSAP